MMRLVSLATVMLAATAQAETVQYTLDQEQSRVYVLVHRGGLFSHLGHNHVISSKDLSGVIAYNTDAPERSEFNIEMPLAKLVVDDQTARDKIAGAFSGAVPQEDAEGTYKNMTGKSVLNVAEYPVVRVISRHVSGQAPDYKVLTKIQLHGVERDVVVPVKAEMSKDGVIHMQGQFKIKQSDFGIKPLTAGLGAIAVKDALDIQLDLYAKR